MPNNRNLAITLHEFQSASCDKRIWDILSDFAVNHSVFALVYHHLPPPGAPDYLDKFSFQRSFVNQDTDFCNIIDMCFERTLRTRARHMVDVEFWSSSCMREQLKTAPPTDRRLLDRGAQLRGVSIPVHGPSGRNGCFSVCFSDDCDIADINDIQNLRWVCQNAHQSYCRYLEEQHVTRVVLTPRETEILQWMALGKSNGVIADILDISHHTVNTYVRRIFLKTNTSDRTSASLYGISNGLIKL